MIEAHFASKEQIDAVVFDPEIYDRISDDKSPPKEQFQVPYTGALFIAGTVEGEIASLTIVHNSKVHFMVLKPFRKCAHELWKESYRLCPRRLWATVPSLYKTLINFAKKHGFREVEIKKQSYPKRGKLYDNHVLLHEA